MNDSTAESLRALLMDLAEFHACRRLKGRILPLSSGSTGDGQRATIGIFRIDTCDARRTDSKHLRIDITGTGWQWISKTKEKLGATFSLDENVRFQVSISMQGTFDMIYDQGEHILTVWFLPTQPVYADLRAKGGVGVDNDTLWSAIVGTAGTILGQSPEETAKKSIRKQGIQKFTSRLSRGFTMMVNLCTGEQHIRLGTFPAGVLPQKADTPGERIYLVNSRGTLHTRSLLMAGPFDSRKTVIARLDVEEGGGVRAYVACEEEARKAADAYANQGALPRMRTLAQTDVRPGEKGLMKVKVRPGCKVVLIMKPLDERKTPVSFRYRMHREGDRPKAFVRCRR